jgi:hypothetical protein
VPNSDGDVGKFYSWEGTTVWLKPTAIRHLEAKSLCLACVLDLTTLDDTAAVQTSRMPGGMVLAEAYPRGRVSFVAVQPYTGNPYSTIFSVTTRQNEQS